MSQENVARYLQGIDAWNRGALDDWLEALVTPGWTLVTGGAFPGLAPTYRGKEGAIELWNAMRGPWEAQDLNIAVDRVEDLGDTALVLLTMQARGGSSGAPVAIKWAHAVASDGGDLHIRSYATWSQGLEAVGLTE